MGSVHRRFNKANINALLQLGYIVELAANFENGEGPEIHNQKYVEECMAMGITTHSIPFQRHSLTGSLKCLPAVKQLLREGQYNIVHAHTETGGLILRLAKSAKGNSKFFYTPHGMSFWKGSPLKNQLLYKPMERYICGGMDQNIGINLEEVTNLNNWDRQSSNYIHGIGLNFHRFEKPTRSKEEVRKDIAIPETATLLMSVGELDDNKNHATAIKALGKLGRKDVYYIVCGVGPNKDMLETYAKDNGIYENVKLLGYRSDIPDLLHASDIFIFPSFHEGLPVSVLESMATGLPSICSEIRGNVDIITDGDNGYLFAPNDVDTLATKMELLICNKDAQIQMGKKNTEIVKAFGMDAVIEELKQIYSK